MSIGHLIHCAVSWDININTFIHVIYVIIINPT